MATKKQVQQAMAFSRRRAATALISGRPGGREVEPARPMRAVVAGMVLAAMVVGGSLVAGMIRPALPDGWQNSSLVLASDSGARYAAVDGVLYAVPNTTSARLVIPASEFDTVTTSESRIAGLPRGRPIGISGAPAALPQPRNLADQGWVACPAGTGTAVLVDPTSTLAQPTPAGALVSQGQDEWLVLGQTRYLISPARRDAVVRALGMARVAVTPVTPTWLNLFRLGSALDAPQVDGEGTVPANPLVIDGASVPVGTVISVGPGTDATSYVLTANGELAPISPLARDLYLLSAPAQLAVDPTAVAGRATAPAAVGPADWPAEAPQALAAGQVACGLLVREADGSSVTELSSLSTTAPGQQATPAPYLDASQQLQAGVYVRPGYGALARGVPQAGTAHGATVLIDDSGFAFPIPDPSGETMARLGYADGDVAEVPQAWLALFPPGPALSAAAAGAELLATDKGDATDEGDTQ